MLVFAQFSAICEIRKVEECEARRIIGLGTSQFGGEKWQIKVVLTCGTYKMHGAYRAWKWWNLKFKFSRPGKSWKLMESKPNGCHISDPCTCFRPLHRSLSTVRLGSICCLVDLVHVYENLTCLIST